MRGLGHVRSVVRYYSYCGHGTGTPGDDDPSEMDGYHFTYDARREISPELSIQAVLH